MYAVTSWTEGANFTPTINFLAEVNGRSKTHTLSFEEIQNECERVEADLRKRLIRSCNLKGATFMWRPEISLPHDYKWWVNTTEISVVRLPDGWQLTAAKLIKVPPQDPGLLKIQLPGAALEDIREAIEDFRKQATKNIDWNNPVDKEHRPYG